MVTFVVIPISVAFTCTDCIDLHRIKDIKVLLSYKSSWGQAFLSSDPESKVARV